MELNDFKNYLHVDSDLTDDDSLIQSLMTSAKEYIVNSTGKEWTESADTPLMLTCAKLLVAHWYSDRALCQNPTSRNTTTALRACCV